MMLRILDRRVSNGPKKVLALGTPSIGLERYFDFLQYLRILTERQDGVDMQIEVINSLPNDT